MDVSVTGPQLKYLVLQWRDSEMTLDELIQAEEALELWVSQAGLAADFTGNDIGENEMNLFIRCKDPVAVFEIAKRTLEQRRQFAGVRAAYRLRDGDEYTALWPIGMTDFTVT